MRLLIAIAGSLCMSFIEASSEFHLSLVGDNAEAPTQVDYMLDWITANSSESDSSRIIFGTKADDLQYSVTGTFAGEVEEATGTKVTCWYALLPGLEPGSKIYYRLEDEENDIESNFFVVDEGKTTWAVFGDMGAPIHKQASGISFPALKNALDNENAYQGILNIGDLGYELVRESGKSFMEEFATLTSRVPMHTTVGNVSS
jgi:hypothetical protein